MLSRHLRSDFADIVERSRAEHEVPGLSVAVFSESLFYSTNAGSKDLQTQAEVDAGTIFPCASLSKPVAAYVALKLAQEGMLDLDAPMGSYSSGIEELDDPVIGALTLGQVLSHKSGLPNWRKPGEALKLRVKPDSRFMYSGEGYLLAQKLMVAVTSSSFDTLARQLVFDIFDMANSRFSWRDRFRELVVTGHDEQLNCIPAPQFAEPNAAYTLFSTPVDYIHFLRGVQTSGSLLASMRRPQVTVDDNLSWGLGWSLTRTLAGDCLWHIGDLVQFVSLALYFPDKKTGFVCMTNSQNGRAVCETLAKRLLGDGLPVGDWINSFFNTFKR